MEWSRIREQYKRELAAAKHRGLNQTTIAIAGGCRQPDISRIIDKKKHTGPRADILINAIEGLGVPVSEFFKRVETGEPAGPGVAPRPIGRALVVQTLIDALQIAIDTLRRSR